MIYYYIYKFSIKDRAEIKNILDNQQGWRGQNHIFIMTKDISEANVIISKESNAFLKKRFTSPELHGLSVTSSYYDGRPSEIWINQNNWNNIPKDFLGSKSLYHEYLIQHEMGHVLGYKHKEPGLPTEPCPVMYQQTKGTRNKCISNPWIKIA